jgi:aminomethyltransferase
VVFNASNKAKDLAHFRTHLTPGVEVVELTQSSLLAVQGPRAAEVLHKLLRQVDLTKLKFMQGLHTYVPALNQAPVTLTRCGYTGEDGFEISVSDSSAVALADLLITASEGVLKPAGLGARDSLRLEAGLCLYGNDIDESISPIEAGLAWTIGKVKKVQGGFLGDTEVLRQIKEGVSKKRVGFEVLEGASARGGVAITKDGVDVGKVTSGTFSPVLRKGVGMAYIASSSSKLGTKLTVTQRGKAQLIQVVKMPFVPAHYYK